MTEWRIARGATAASLVPPDASLRSTDASLRSPGAPVQPPEESPRSPGARATGLIATGDLQQGSDAPPPGARQAIGARTEPAALIINGEVRELQGPSRQTLAQVLHDAFGLAGTRVACDRGECGACTVLIDGRTRLACMTLAASVVGRRVTTVEGLAAADGAPNGATHAGALGRLQRAFLANDAYQCGYCTPGFLMAAAGLLQKRPEPTRNEVVAALAGNLCRCGAYEHIVAAVLEAAGAAGGDSDRAEEGPA